MKLASSFESYGATRSSFSNNASVASAIAQGVKGIPYRNALRSNRQGGCMRLSLTWVPVPSEQGAKERLVWLTQVNLRKHRHRKQQVGMVSLLFNR